MPTCIYIRAKRYHTEWRPFVIGNIHLVLCENISFIIKGKHIFYEESENMTSEKDKEIERLTRAIKFEKDDSLKEKYIKRKVAIENGEIIIKEKDSFENMKYQRPIKNMNVASG